ncbi:uncharacterized protein TNCV_5004721 [Trichonephila clavipes]|uniref:Uncharacterized protein n=1 Tax=Trichonephila clavipes TaxID=2585209 RepID=A0A8X6UY04_TRICX|nr:uncharacterized protein TNCV_5004721 [Trichonephila clavipes]
MTFLLRERKDVLLEVAKELRVEVDITLPKIEFKKRICQSKYYGEESVKCLLEGILEEEREEQEIKKFEERRLARERELERLRVQLRNKLNENKLKAGNKINDLANVCILSENRTTEVSESVNKCRPVNNPVVNKSVKNVTSCDFEKKNCDPPVRWTNVSPLSEVSGRGTEQNNLFKIVKGKEFNVYRNSNWEVNMKAGLCERRVKTVAMGAQRVINPDDIGDGSFELKRDKGVTNPGGLICENICEEKYTIGTLMGCEKQITVNRESFRNHTMAKIAGQSNRTLPVVWLGRGFVKGILETGGVMDKCVQMWTRNYGALGQTARVCFGVLCANKKKEEVKRDFGDLRIRRSEGRVVNTPLVFKRAFFEERKKRRGDPKGEVEEKRTRESGRENGRREEERWKRERGDGKRLKESRGERESEARLEWRKRAESGNWSEKDDERRWR